ncbi:restriction endonuclease subunit S [Ruminococcus sp.]|uniref:restriction endonuclease subunit S n=1 Tax=Ruminococcus sp. TaxID=41978 RepID=UPI0025D6B77E|nr:restriction endonuclease subunit S [Ruminococcus sp.]
MDYVNSKATGGTIKHLNQSILVDFPVQLPESAEQQKIGAYFSHLDTIITLHQRKCKTYKYLQYIIAIFTNPVKLFECGI